MMRPRRRNLHWLPLLGALSFIGAAPGSGAGTSPSIRVRLQEKSERVTIEGYDLRWTEEAKTPRRWSGDRTTRWEVRCRRGKIELVRSQPSLWVPVSQPLSVESATGQLLLAGRPVWGKLRITPLQDGCETVNTLGLERYLEGVVNAEFSSKWKETAIDAQVIAARTYALYQVQERKKIPSAAFDVDATVKDQVYQGPKGEDYLATRSVERTRGMILTAAPVHAAEIRPVKAFYHSTCGGVTELPEKVWGRGHEGFRRRVVCASCLSSPRFRWGLELEGEELAARIRAGVRALGNSAGTSGLRWPGELLTDLERAVLVDVREQGASFGGGAGPLSTRSERVELDWSLRSGTLVRVSVLPAKFREWVGFDRLRSTGFTVAKVRPSAGNSQSVASRLLATAVNEAQAGRKSARFRFEGRGNGHGVGLCQWGAKTLGEAGQSTGEILRHYYPDARIAKLW